MVSGIRGISDVLGISEILAVGWFLKTRWSGSCWSMIGARNQRAVF